MDFSYNIYSPSDGEDKLADATDLTSGKQLFELIMQIAEQYYNKKNDDPVITLDDDSEGKILSFNSDGFLNDRRYGFNVNIVFDDDDNTDSDDKYIAEDDSDEKMFLHFICDVWAPAEKNIIQFASNETQTKQYLKDYTLPLSEADKKEINNLCTTFVDNGMPPDFSSWDDSTEYAFFSQWGPANEKIFRLAFSNYRRHKPEIFKAFSFKHLSDVTQYYVHPNNNSYKGTTSLAQSIGEGITLFQMMFNSKTKKGPDIADGSLYQAVYINDSNNTEDSLLIGYYAEIHLGDTWRRNGIVPADVYSYKAVLGWQNMITVAAYDKDGVFLQGKRDETISYYQYLPIFLLCLVREMETDSEYKQLVFDYCENPTVERFVRIHEDLYQAHKDEEYHISYSNLKYFEPVSHLAEEKFICLSDEYETVSRNRNAKAKKLNDMTIQKFEKGTFSHAYDELIPSLGAEFVMDKKLKPVCNALVAGDARAVLLHGPAGTGKTIGCKLMCSAIGLPVMETVNCTENLDEFVLGKYIPKDDKIVFSESYVTKTIREGGAVVFEEINFAKPQHLAFLNSLLDDNGFVRLDNGEIVKRNNNFRFFATMNMGYFGTKELNQALYNRFNAIIELDELSDEAISSMLAARVPECKDCVEKVVSVYHKIKAKIQNDELDYVISPRNLENWVRLAKYEGYISAAEQALIPIAKSDRAFEKAIRSLIELYAW